MRRTTRNIEIDRDYRVRSVVDLGMVQIGTSGNGARPYSNHNLGRRHGLISFPQGQLHVLGDRAGDEQPVRVSRRGDKLNPESTQIKDDRIEDIDVRLAAVAAAGAHLAELERSAQQMPYFLVQGLRR